MNYKRLTDIPVIKNIYLNDKYTKINRLDIHKEVKHPLTMQRASDLTTDVVVKSDLFTEDAECYVIFNLENGDFLCTKLEIKDKSVCILLSYKPIYVFEEFGTMYLAVKKKSDQIFIDSAKDASLPNSDLLTYFVSTKNIILRVISAEDPRGILIRNPLFEDKTIIVRIGDHVFFEDKLLDKDMIIGIKDYEMTIQGLCAEVNISLEGHLYLDFIIETK